VVALVVTKAAAVVAAGAVVATGAAVPFVAATVAGVLAAPVFVAAVVDAGVAVLLPPHAARMAAAALPAIPLRNVRRVTR